MKRAQCARTMGINNPARTIGALPEPRTTFFGGVLRAVDGGDAAPQIDQLITRLERELDRTFGPRGGATQPDRADQGLALFITRPDGAGGRRLYRFLLSLQLDRCASPTGLRPRYFAEAVRLGAGEVVYALDADDGDFASLLTELRRVVQSVGGDAARAGNPNALLAPDFNKSTGARGWDGPDPDGVLVPDCARTAPDGDPDAIGGDPTTRSVAATCLVSRKYALVSLPGGDPAALLHALEENVAAVESALRAEFAGRGVVIEAHPQSYRVVVSYTVPASSGEARRFAFEIELQVSVVDGDGGAIKRLVPRVFAEVTRVDARDIICKERDNDAFFTGLVQEVDSVLRRLARG